MALNLNRLQTRSCFICVLYQTIRVLSSPIGHFFKFFVNFYAVLAVRQQLLQVIGAVRFRFRSCCEVQRSRPTLRRIESVEANPKSFFIIVFHKCIVPSGSRFVKPYRAFFRISPNSLAGIQDRFFSVLIPTRREL